MGTAPTAYEATAEKHGCFISSRGRCQVLVGSGGARRRSKKSARNAQFLYIHLCLIALCPGAHDLIIFIIASASSATNLMEGNKIVQALQKMQP